MNSCHNYQKSCIAIILAVILTIYAFPAFPQQVFASVNNVDSKGWITINPLYNESTGRLSVKGKVTDGEKIRVTVKIINFSGNIIYLDEIFSTDDGSFVFKGPITYEEGTYKIYVGSEITEEPYMVNFKVKKGEPIDPEPELEPEPEHESDSGSEPQPKPKPETGIKPPDEKVGDTLEEIAKHIEETLDNLDKIASDKVVSLIEEIFSKIDSLNEGERNGLKEKLGLLIEKTLEKVAQITVSQDMIMVEDDRALAAVDVKALTEVFENISVISNTVLKEYKLDIKPAKVVNINVPAAESINGVTAKIPSGILAVAAENGVDEIFVNTQMGSIAIKVSTLNPKWLKGTENIELSIDIVDKGSLAADIALKTGDSIIYDINMYVDGNPISSFNNKNVVEITLDYSLKEGEDPDRVIVYYINDRGRLEVIKNCKYSPETKKVKFSVNHFSKYTIRHSDMTFDDINQAEWARTYIEALAGREIVKGIGNGCFEPNRSITRAEFAKMLTEIFELVDETAETEFSDVSRDKWYYTYVASAYKSGIVKGTGGNCFGPDTLINREDMITMAYRAVNAAGARLKSSVEAKTFDDKQNISDYALEAIMEMQRAGIVAGTGKSKFEPKANATRAEAAKIIYLLFKEL